MIGRTSPASSSAAGRRAVEHIRFLEEQIAHVDRDAQALAAAEYMLRTEVAASAMRTRT